ncbi:MAG: hypothetical protein FWH01_03880 [Oscillospiraceae bacterium]|nr:hypothetical protein [Oscillospiraceae bacterium]
MDIWLHDDAWVEGLLGGKILSREKLHHWPLSYVEKITLQSNARYVYKSQRSASSVEKEFYSKVKMPFIASPIYSGTYENCDIMVLPYLDHPTLGEASETEFEKTISYISRLIQDIPDMPVFFDLSSVEKLAQIINLVCTIFEGKGEERNIAILQNWVSKRAHKCYDNQQIGNVHGDLGNTNILIENGMPRYILDWQRPMFAPVVLENALAYRLAGYDAVKKYGDLGILALICHFIWYSYACKEFMPFVYNNAHKLLLEFISLVGEH